MTKAFIYFYIILWFTLSFWNVYWDSICTYKEWAKLDWWYSYKSNNITDLLYSKNWEHYAFKVNWLWDYIVRDGIVWKKYERIYGLIYSNWKNSLSYIAKNQDDYFIVKDGVEWKKYDNISQLNYIWDSTKLIFIAKHKGKEFTIKDGIEWKKYDGISQLNLYSHWEKNIYIAKLNGKSFLVENQKEWEKYDRIYELAISTDWKSKAIKVFKNNNLYIVKDSVKIDKYVNNWNLTYSKNNDFAFVANKNWKNFVVLNGIESKNNYSEISWNSQFYKPGNDNLLFSPNGDKLAYYAKSWKSIIVIDNVEHSKYKKVFWFQYSNKWSHYSYIGEKDWMNILIIDGIETFSYDKIYNFIYSDNWESYSFIAKNDWKYIIIKDGVEIQYFNKNSANHVRHLKFIPNTNILSFTVKDREQIFLVQENCNILSSQSKQTQSKKTLIKQLIISKKHLKNNKEMEKYITKIDLLVEQLSSKKLQKLRKRLWNLTKHSRNNQKYKYFFDYLEAKILLKTESEKSKKEEDITKKEILPKNTPTEIEKIKINTYNKNRQNILKGYMEKPRNYLYTYNWLDWKNEENRQISLLDKYANSAFKDIKYWKTIWDKNQIDLSLVMCISLIETSIWKNKTVWFWFNIWNTPLWFEAGNQIDWIDSIFQTLNNDYLKSYTRIEQLSRYWNDKWAIYTVDKVNWHKDIIKCMTFLKWYTIPDNYNYRIK